MKKIIVFLFLIFLVKQLSAEYSKAYVLTCNGIINSIMASYLVDSIKSIEKKNDGIIIIEMDTPGGVLESTRDITITIMNSPIPIIGYVYPEGARAASAGAFIILSCDKAAMAPTSNIGAAHPVNLGQKMDKVMEEKVVNDTAAFITGIAKKRNRNPNIAEKMVRQSISITAKRAQEVNIIDYQAINILELLKKLNNNKIKKDDKIIILKTKNLQIINKPMNLFEKFLHAITNPNIAYILLLLGIYGVLAEFSSPGVGFPGVVGGMALILALFSLNTLPINLAGVIFIILSIVFFILELNTSSSGILGIGAVISFVLGSIMLIRTSAEFLKISPYLIITGGLFGVLLILFMVFVSVKIQRTKPKTGREGIIGALGIARSDIKPRGQIFVQGELWQAKSLNNEQIEKGDEIKVVDIKNLLLVVTRVK